MKETIIVIAFLLGTTSASLATDTVQQATNYAEVATAINATMRAHHFDPEELDSDDYKQVEAAVSQLAETSTTDEEFVSGFREIWNDGPFSHVELRAAHQSADDLASYLDTLRIGGGGAVLTWRDDVAILTVNTMMGLDTIEEINAAYAAITNGRGEALIIDLRENRGGAFAVRPLVAHLVSEPVAGGSFVSQQWTKDHRRAPTDSELQSIPSWAGWSIKTFWNDVQKDGVLRVNIEPQEPVFSGPVYVLTSERTASAAELATAILQSAGRATIVGENTAGQMLSQKIYDVPGGFHLSLPIADYYSATSDRIEGVGISPDIETGAVDALTIALQQLAVQ